MAITVGKSRGLTLGGSIVIRNYDPKTRGFYAQREVKDGGVGDADKKRDGKIVYNGGRNLTSFVQIKDPKKGYNDNNVFWRFVQDAKAGQKKFVKMALVVLTAKHGLKKGARIYFQNSTGTKNLNVLIDNKSADLDKSGNKVKFATFINKGASGRLVIGNNDKTSHKWIYNSTTGNASLEKVKPKGVSPAVARTKIFLRKALITMESAINGDAKSGNNLFYAQAEKAFSAFYPRLKKMIGPNWAKDAQVVGLGKKFTQLKLMRQGYSATLRHAQLVNDIASKYEVAVNNSIIKKFGNISTEFQGKNSLEILAALREDLGRAFTSVELVTKADSKLINAVFEAQKARVPQIHIAKALGIKNWQNMDRGLENVTETLASFPAQGRKWLAKQASAIWTAIEHSYLPAKRGEANQIDKAKSQAQLDLVMSILGQGGALLGAVGGAASLYGSIATYSVRAATVKKTQSLLDSSKADRDYLLTTKPDVEEGPEFVKWKNDLDQKEREIGKNEMDLGNYKTFEDLEKIKIGGWTIQFIPTVMTIDRCGPIPAYRSR